MQGVYYEPQRDDREPCVKIGMHNGPDDTQTTQGISIGGGCLQKQQNGNKNVVVGLGCLRNTTDNSSVGNTIIGDSCAEVHSGAGFSNNVLIGSHACADSSTAANIANNTAVGSNSLRGTVQSNIVCIGAEAGNLAAGGTLYSGSISIGAGTNHMFGAQNVGANSISIGTQSASEVPADSVLIGRGVTANGSNAGQIVLGNASNHTSLALAVENAITMNTGTGGSLTMGLSLSPNSATLRSNLFSQLACGSNYVNVGPTNFLVSNMPIVLTNPVICDSNGKSIMGIGSSQYVSGRSDGFPGAAAETRSIYIGANSYFADDDSTTRQPVVHTGDSSTDTMFPSQVSATDARAYGGMRVYNASESFVIVDDASIPFGWKIVAVSVSLYSKTNTSASNKTIEIFSRTRDFDSVVFPPMNSDHITVHKSHNTSPAPMTNALVPLSTHFTPSGSNQLFIYISTGNSNSVFTGAYAHIMRI